MNSPVIATRLNPEDYDALTNLAQREGLSRSDLMRQAVADLLASMDSETENVSTYGDRD